MALTSDNVKNPFVAEQVSRDSGYYDVVVVGGFGHVGLPLAVSFASCGLQVCALDINSETGAAIERGAVPFMELGCEPMLRLALKAGTFHTSLDSSVLSRAAAIIIVIGTPVDRHLNPEFDPILLLVDSMFDHLVDGQLIMLRSTVYPGTTDRLRDLFARRGKRVELAFCPERVAEGHAIEEIRSLPQILGAYSSEGFERCRALFAPLTTDVVELTPLEAELAKLFTNTWRYTLFATANQFYMLANDNGADFYRIHHAMTHNYPRVQGLPRPGFAAGPCLFKDAMQLAAFNNNRFYLGHAAMLVNEGLPNYLIDRLKRRYDLSAMTIGILGMAFKAESDDPRESLSYKLKKILAFESGRILCSDAYIQEEGLVTPDALVAESDVIVVGAPHREYASLTIPENKVVVDVWNLFGNGCVL